MRFANSKAAGMGEQLPSGVVRIYMRDARGQPQFVGEDHIGHTSAGSEMALKIGDAFDVTVQPTLVQTRRITKRKTEYDMSYLVRNARHAQRRDLAPVRPVARERGAQGIDRGPAHRLRTASPGTCRCPPMAKRH